MSVLKGEGKVPIIFNTVSISAGALTHTAYLARPDLAGEWPTVVVLPSAWGLTGSSKDLTRRIARQGFAAVCPDVHNGRGQLRSLTRAEAEAMAAQVPPLRVRRALDDLIAFVTNPTGFWSNSEDGFGLLGIGAGGVMAADLAQRYPTTPVALVAVPLVPHGVGPDEAGPGEAEEPAEVEPAVFLDRLSGLSDPLIGFYGREDETVPIDDVMAARDAIPHAEWVLYHDVGADFLDDSMPGFDAIVQRDVIERAALFFAKNLPELR